MTMTPFIHPLFRLCGAIQLPADALKALAVFFCAGLFIFIVFSAQLFLMDQIEQRHLFRRDRQPQPDKPSPSRPLPQKRE
jgi:hypothetical protein